MQQRTSVRTVVLLITQTERVNTRTFELPVATDSALYLPTYLLLDRLLFLVLNYELFANGAEYGELSIYLVYSNTVPPIFRSHPEPVGTVLRIVRPMSAAQGVVELN